MQRLWRGSGLGPLWRWDYLLKKTRHSKQHWQCEGQDRQCQGKDSGQRGEKILVKTHTGKTSSLWPVGCISDQFPTRGTPRTSLRLARQVSASHDKSRPREVSASHEKSGPDWYVGSDARHEPCHRRAWRNESQQLPAMQVACPGKSLNAGLTSCTVITSHHLPLCHMQAQPEALKHPLQHAQA
jgi:hypothetical protein